MNIKRIAKILAVSLGIFVAAFLLHTSILAKIPLGVVTPNVLLMITSVYGFMKSPNYGMIMGFFAGLLVDCYYPEYFGLNCLIFLFLGYINGMFSKIYYGEDIKLPLLLVGGSDVIYGIAIYTFLFLSRQRYDFSFYLLNIIIPEAVYTLVVFLVLYYPLLKIMRWIAGGQSKGKDYA